MDTLKAGQRAVLNGVIELINDRSAVLTIAGYAGTGKTYLTRKLLSELNRNGWRLLLLAPTHQALAVARADLSPEIETSTIHSALGLTVREREDGTTEVTSRTRARVRGFDLIVIDEASMVGSDLYRGLMRERECAALFVGDPGQLPPIGERDSPAFSEVAHQFRLTEIVRQAEDSSIIQMAHEIRRFAENGERVQLDALRPYANGETQIQTGDIFTITDLIADARQAGMNAVAITYRNDDVDRINAGVHRALYPDTTTPFAEGERILFRAPYHEDGKEHEEPLVRTNELATVLSISEPVEIMNTAAYELEIRLDDDRECIVPIPVNSRAWRRAWNNLFARHRAAKNRAQIAADPLVADRLRDEARSASAAAWLLRTRLANVQHAYAMTAHRSQGSTFDVAVLHWTGLNYMRDDFDHARATYVAATRPSQYLVIVEE